MSQTNQWRKRHTIKLTCPSGNTAICRRPGPDLALKAGKIARILKQQNDAGGDINKQLEVIERLPDEELNKLMAFGNVLLADVVVDPPLSVHPKEGQLSPDDVPLADYWFIYTWAMNGGPDMPVDLTNGEETTVEAVGMFPGGQDTGADASGDSEQVQ